MKHKPKLFEELPSWLAVGAQVDYHAVIGREVTQPRMTVTVVQQQPAYGRGRNRCQARWVVWLEGKAGYVAAEALTPCEPQPVDPARKV